MSYTELFAFDKTGNASKVEDIRNAWLGAMKIWRILESKYLPEYRLEYPLSDFFKRENPDFVPSRTSDMKDIKEIWELAYDERLLEHERIVLLSTFDNVLVKRENFVRLIEAFRKFEPGTSLPEQADVIEEESMKDDVIAIGWNQTSINADNWEYYDIDEETDEGIPYNCLSGEKHWWLFEGLEEICLNFTK